MAVIAKSNGTFNQKHQGSNIQSNRNNDLKHGSNHLTVAKVIAACAKLLRKLKILEKSVNLQDEEEKNQPLQGSE